MLFKESRAALCNFSGFIQTLRWAASFRLSEIATWKGTFQIKNERPLQLYNTKSWEYVTDDNTEVNDKS
jgi:hypothetical protein